MVTVADTRSLSPSTRRESRALATALLVLREARPPVQAVFALRLIVAADLVGAPALRSAAVLVGWIPLTIAIYVFNGVTDRQGDIANASVRPIARGMLSPSRALTLSIGLAAAGFSICCAISPWLALVAAVMLLLGWAYSAGPSLKDHPIGFALVIGAGAGLTYLAGALANGHRSEQLVVSSLLIAGWITVACAAKDLSDVDGDRLAGRKTWPVLVGARTAARWLTCAACTVAVIDVYVSWRIDCPLAPAVIIGLGSVYLGVSAMRNSSKPSRADRRRPYRAFMLVQYVTNIAVAISFTQ